MKRRSHWVTLLREAVINALVHADYSQHGAPIRVAVFDDRIEIENPGILLAGITVEDMRQGISRIRNHVIARVFRELNLIEQWGSGVRRIFSEAAAQGSPEPQVIEVGMRLRVLVHLAEAIRPVQVTEQVTEQVARFVEFLKQGPLSTREAMERLELQHRPTFSANYLLPAMNAGLVEMTQPESPTSPTQKYRLFAPVYRSGRTQVEPEGQVMNEATDTDLCKRLLHNCSGVDPDDSRPGHFTAGIQ